MPTLVVDTLKPKGVGGFPVVEAQDVQMPDGTRLSDLSVSYPIAEEGTELQPEKYYVFGEVDSLSVILASVDDGKVHEHCFEFIPSENFTGLTVDPEPKWANEPQFLAGKTCQVSILRGIGVTVSA